MCAAADASLKEQPNREGPQDRQTRQPRPRGFRRFRRRVVRLLGLAVVLALPLFFLTRWLLTPGTIPRTEIAPGVFFEAVVQDHPEFGEGSVMITEVHWDTPGVEIALRPFDESLAKRGFHHRLGSPSWMVFWHDCLVLMNTTRFGPGEWYHNYPGSPVSCHESVAIHGQWSHVHEHSYMLWWDDAGNAKLETSKPPSQPALSKAVTAIGMQAIQISDGKVNYGCIGGHLNGGPFAQSYVGIDNDRKILWIMAFDHATERNASEFMVSRGVKFGGRLDSGRGTAKVIGPAAKGVFPFLGIRNERLVANYIAIRYRKP